MRPGNPLAEKPMDLRNNKIGAGIGRLGGTDKQLSTQCMAALNAGKLIFY